MPMQTPMQHGPGMYALFIAQTIGVLAICSGADSHVLVLHRVQPTALLSRIQRLGEGQPGQPLVQPLLPPARPIQPWPYRQLSSAKYAEITGTETYALVATVQHAPLKGEPVQLSCTPARHGNAE